MYSFRFSLAWYALLRHGDETTPPTGGNGKNSHGFDTTQFVTELTKPLLPRLLITAKCAIQAWLGNKHRRIPCKHTVHTCIEIESGNKNKVCQPGEIEHLQYTKVGEDLAGSLARGSAIISTGSYTHTYIHKHTHTYIYTYIHTYTFHNGHTRPAHCLRTYLLRSRSSAVW